jgi:hypothetical protein
MDTKRRREEPHRVGAAGGRHDWPWRRRLSRGRAASTAPRLGDYPLRAIQIASARLFGRNPPIPPWRRRWIRLWQTDQPGPGPSESSHRRRALIFAVAAAWNEGDIIYATVRNLFDQGADRVLLIDDESADETADEAAAAGAQVISVPSRGVYCERERGERIQHVIRAETDRAGSDVWWIVVDADEFPRGPAGATIRQLVEGLPGWVDVVGSRVLDHFPRHPDGYCSREHPLGSFPLAQWYLSPYCPKGHWKHQLLRVRDVADVLPMPGHHVVSAGDGRRVREAARSLLMHHVPLRNRDRTEARLREASMPGGRYGLSPDRFTRWRVRQRLAAIEHVYAGRYESVPSCYAGEPRLGVVPTDWRELVPEDERDFRRP